MRSFGFGSGRVGGLAAIMGMAAVLAGCTSIGDTARNLFAGAGQTQNQSDLPPEYFIDIGACPEITIRPGTEALIVHATRAEDEQTPQNVRYQGTIAQTARECARSGDTLTIKVGVAGRVAAGPKGSAGTVTVPVRIAVVKNRDEVLYSQLHPVAVTLAPPNLLAEFAFVEEQISVTSPMAESGALQILVGFDPGN